MQFKVFKVFAPVQARSGMLTPTGDPSARRFHPVCPVLSLQLASCQCGHSFPPPLPLLSSVCP
jgi:hypothetical protein